MVSDDPRIVQIVRRQSVDKLDDLCPICFPSEAMRDPTSKHRPPLTVVEALKRLAEDAVRRDPSLITERTPALDDDRERGPDDTSQP